MLNKVSVIGIHTWQELIKFVERASSAVECRTRNQVSPGSNPPLLPFRRLGIFVLSIDALVARLECFTEKPSWCRNEQVCQGGQKVYGALSGPTDWMLRYIKATLKQI